MPDNFEYEEHTWGVWTGPYTAAYATFGPQGYIGPITVAHPNGRSKVITVEPKVNPDLGPCDQEIEIAVKTAFMELAALGAVIEWKKYIPWIAAVGIGITLLIVVSRPA